jgi:hypothetical protein
VAADEAVLAPEREHRGGDALAARGGRVVVGQVEGRRGPVVLAGGVDRGRLAEAADVLVDRQRVERLAAPPTAADPAAHPAVGIGADLVLGERLGLGEEVPVPVGEPEVQVGRAQRVPGGDDVKDGDLRHRLGAVKRHPVGHPGAPVMADDRELLEAEVAHHQRLVARHRPLGVALVRRAAGRLAAVTVAAQIGQDDRVVQGENGRDVMPHHVGLRVAVQEQDGRAGLVAADQRVDPDASGGESDPLEQVGQRNGHGSVIPVMEVT